MLASPLLSFRSKSRPIYLIYIFLRLNNNALLIDNIVILDKNEEYYRLKQTFCDL